MDRETDKVDLGLPEFVPGGMYGDPLDPGRSSRAGTWGAGVAEI